MRRLCSAFKLREGLLRNVLFVLSSGFAIATPICAAAETSVEWSTGGNYSSGAYGAAVDTEITYAPVTARVTTDRLRLDISVPYISITGPGGSVSGGVVIPGTGPVASHSGLGDVVVSAALQLIERTERAPKLDLEGAVKLPTADDQLGTGETDTSAQFSLQQPLGGGVTVLASAGYQWYGDPDTYTLEDGPIGSLGLDYAASEHGSVGLVANYRSRYLSTLEEQIMVSPYFTLRSASGWSLTGYGTAGFTNSSPEYAAGIVLGRTFGGR